MDADLPNELSGPLPRRVCATRQGFWIATGTAMILLIALVANLWLGKNAMRQMQNWEALHRDGSETTGVVTRLKTGKQPMVYYAFTVKGVSFTANAFVPKQVLQNLQDASSLPIRYLPANPAVSHPVDWDSAPIDSVWFMLPLPVVLFSIMYLTSLRRERQLVIEGVPAVGVITKFSYGGRAGYAARYEFRTADGRVMTKRVGVPGPVKVGSKIWVLYLRQNPRRSQIYPSPNYHVA